jgi:hypothetical protein
MLAALVLLAGTLQLVWNTRSSKYKTDEQPQPVSVQEEKN